MSRQSNKVKTIPTEKINSVYVPYLDNQSRIQIFYGGSSSGKSVFLAQRDVIDVCKGGRNFLVCRQVGRTLRGSVVQEVRKVISDYGLSDQFAINKTDGTVTHRNGYQIVFAGLDDIEKLKSITPAKGVFTDVRVEEATETERNTIKQLIKRQRGGDPNTPKRLTLSFNPILQSNWIYQEYFSKVAWADDQKQFLSDKLCILKTTYKDNKFLTDDDRADLENESDKYYHDVYTLGNWGILGNVIFTNVILADLLDEKSDYYLPVDLRVNRRNGLDFGFSSNPAALHRSHYDREKKRIYIYDEIYDIELTNEQLAKQVIAKVEKDLVTCDSAEPKSIKEIQGHGVNAKPARKGKDSISHGIRWLKGQTIIIDKNCIAARNEFSTYHWKEDSMGRPTETPVDKDNHLIDATRYAYEDDMIEAVSSVPNPFYD